MDILKYIVILLVLEVWHISYEGTGDKYHNSSMLRSSKVLWEIFHLPKKITNDIYKIHIGGYEWFIYQNNFSTEPFFQLKFSTTFNWIRYFEGPTWDLGVMSSLLSLASLAFSIPKWADVAYKGHSNKINVLDRNYPLNSRYQ